MAHQSLFPSHTSVPSIVLCILIELSLPDDRLVSQVIVYVQTQRKKIYVSTHHTLYHVQGTFDNQNFNVYVYFHSLNDKYLSFEKL